MKKACVNGTHSFWPSAGGLWGPTQLALTQLDLKASSSLRQPSIRLLKLFACEVGLKREVFTGSGQRRKGQSAMAPFIT